MARDESDREDLIREAVAFPRRVEWVDGERTTVVFAGIGRDGRLSVYFDADPVYHFDAEDRLRRAFVGGCLLRTTGAGLAEMTRVRDEASTTLRRREMPGDETAELLESIQSAFQTVLDAVDAGELSVNRYMPEDDESVASDLLARFASLASSPIQLAPPIAGKR